ncbi:MAG: hypothetical protein M1816_006002 [Peltula sp. TS41687]|nr:MAG: hypothetical protein M1816_006002 [Peltula sp. TS41687]
MSPQQGAFGLTDNYLLQLPTGTSDIDSSSDRRPSWSSRSQDGDETDGSCGTSATSLDDVVLHRPLAPGIYVPTLAFFDRHTESLDLETTAAHAIRLAEAGVAGLATQGSNGEAVHLTHTERKAITRATRQALNGAGFHEMPIIVGCGAQSTRETVELCRDAMDAGGDYALILPPSYYRPMVGPAMVREFFTDVADTSPIPILIYNYPGAASGVDLDSDDIIALSKHPNIVGCKLTCGNTGKLTRIASATSASTPADPDYGSGFMCLGGSADFTLPMLVGGGSGGIYGLANVAPKACVELIRLYTSGRVLEAQKLQAVVARADWVAIKSGIVGAKSALESYFGYGGNARKPLPRPSKAEAEKYAEEWKEVVMLERSL